MKKIFVLALALTMCLLAGCRGAAPTGTTNGTNNTTGNTPTGSAPSTNGSTPSNGTSTDPTEPTGGNNAALSDMELRQIVDAIYDIESMELMLGTIDVDLSDSYAVKSYLGLDSAADIQEAVASESMFGSQAYSLVLCRVKDAANAKNVAQAMHDGIDQRKWVCVYADDLMVSTSGDVVMLVMISSEYASSATAQSLTDAFRQVAGGTLSAEIK